MAILLITHYQRMLELHQAGPRARDGGGPDRALGRPGAGASSWKEGYETFREPAEV